MKSWNVEGNLITHFTVEVTAEDRYEARDKVHYMSDTELMPEGMESDSQEITGIEEVKL